MPLTVQKFGTMKYRKKPNDMTIPTRPVICTGTFPASFAALKATVDV